MNEFPCRNCQQSVQWARTDRGKNILVDAEPVADGDLAQVSMGEEMHVRHLRNGEQVDENTRRYFCHFGTCPKRDPFRSHSTQRP